MFELLRVSRGGFRSTVETRRQDDHELSVTDVALITLCDRHDVDGVLSFDTDSEGLVTRYEPSAYV